MTKEEAKRTLSLHLMQCGMLMPIEWVLENGEGSKLREAFRVAFDALEAASLPPVTEPTVSKTETDQPPDNKHPVSDKGWLLKRWLKED